MAGEIEWICEDIAPDGKLPGDVMVSILTYLPVKSLLKFKSVSKPWCSLISSPHFVKIHLHRQSVALNNNCIMSLKDASHSVGQDRKFGLLNLTDNYNTPVDDHVLMLEIPPFDLRTFDSCNGLVCFISRFKMGSPDLVLWNPATRRYRCLDFPEGDDLDFRTLGLCYVDDFKILVWNHTHYPSPLDTPYLYVYTLSSDSWDKLDFYPSKTEIYFEPPPTFIGRCMHWLSDTCPNSCECTCSSSELHQMLAFDVMDGTMSSFHTPITCGRYNKRLKHTLVIRGCLSIVVLRDSMAGDVDPMEWGFEVFVMEEYGVEGSWVKRFFIQEEFAQVQLPLTSWNYGEIVFNCIYEGKRVVILYDPCSKKKKCVEFVSLDILDLSNYVESLASVETS